MKFNECGLPKIVFIISQIDRPRRTQYIYQTSKKKVPNEIICHFYCSMLTRYRHVAGRVFLIRYKYVIIHRVRCKAHTPHSAQTIYSCLDAFIRINHLGTHTHIHFLNGNGNAHAHTWIQLLVPLFIFFFFGKLIYLNM